MLKQVTAKLAAVGSSKALRVAPVVASLLAGSAFASDAGSSATGMAAVTAAADTVVTFVGKGFDLMTGNPLTAVYLASGLIGVGLNKFIKMRKAAH